VYTSPAGRASRSLRRQLQRFVIRGYCWNACGPLGNERVKPLGVHHLHCPHRPSRGLGRGRPASAWRKRFGDSRLASHRCGTDGADDAAMEPETATDSATESLRSRALFGYRFSDRRGHCEPCVVQNRPDVGAVAYNIELSCAAATSQAHSLYQSRLTVPALVQASAPTICSAAPSRRKRSRVHPLGAG